MKTPLRPGLDDEIHEVEARIARRRAALPGLARDAGRSALHKVASPAGLAVAAAIGFLAGGGLRRNGGKPQARWVKVQATEKKKGVAVGSLLMSAAIALIKAQYGSPAAMAQALLERMPKRKAAASARHDRRPVAG